MLPGRSEAGSLRSLAEALAEAVWNDELTGCVVLLARPDTDEGADADEASAVVVRAGDETKSRVYGFGGRSSLTREWVSRWATATLWQRIRQLPTVATGAPVVSADEAGGAEVDDAIVLQPAESSQTGQLQPNGKRHCNRARTLRRSRLSSMKPVVIMGSAPNGCRRSAGG